jgi:PCO_ADO
MHFNPYRVQIRPIHEDITPLPDEDNNDVLSAVSSPSPTVRYIHLQEVPDQYTMGVFVFPPHAKIPLHDHPGMCVISRILYGDIYRRSLDLPAESDSSDASAGKRRRAFYRTRQKANPALQYQRKGSSSSSDDTDTSTTATTTRSNDGISNIPVETFTAPQCTVLYPHQGNLHEFVAGPNGAAVLDVLLPPYSADHHRDCTFYDVVESDHRLVDENHSGNDKTVAGTTKDGDRNEYVSYSCWIVPTERPEDFHCLSGHYRSLGR